jgi:hypothetical protein
MRDSKSRTGSHEKAEREEAKDGIKDSDGRQQRTA